MTLFEIVQSFIDFQAEVVAKSEDDLKLKASIMKAASKSAAKMLRFMTAPDAIWKTSDLEKRERLIKDLSDIVDGSTDAVDFTSYWCSKAWGLSRGT